MKKLLVLLGISVFMLTGCASSGETEPVESAPTVEESEQPEQTDDGMPDPVPLGTLIEDGDWEVTINSFTPNADAEVFEASGGEDVPDEGKQFAIVNLTLTYVGEGRGETSDVQVEYLPEGGVASGLWEAFGTTPSDKMTFETLTTGGSITGNALYLIDADSTGMFFVSNPTSTTANYVAID